MERGNQTGTSGLVRRIDQIAVTGSRVGQIHDKAIIKAFGHAFRRAVGAEIGEQQAIDPAHQHQRVRPSVDFGALSGTKLDDDTVADHPVNLLLRGKPFGGWRPAVARSAIQAVSSSMGLVKVQPKLSVQVRPSAA